ncbi:MULTISPECIES: hydantoinase B/oxoprolinase family protein [Nonomuraea]|uniref:Hydantoinase B/oxoprolinase family protein n=1 Tax=Nonomuraea ferruginea TaxID=46174 RepID=A0ABT4T4R7_9ACTN|nr:hydantoinase B/oxoprolinase family protein [Nonomuraea ferruginea]MDA0644120.1 hydantoinase B/oxoprolinase family protein [Nonomuraea ferruginea]
MIDEITFEVLRHRLDTINDDAAAVLARLSGSHLAAEARDLNTAIMAPDGRVVCCGRYVLAQVVSMHLVVRDILENYADNPGFGPGDQFVTNDPYIGTLHQPDVVVVAPIFVDGELVGWCGSTAHQADVGGPNPGGITYDARSIFDEAVPMPPVRIVEGGRLRRDLEREYLVRSRTAELNRLDLVGQVAANRSVTAEVGRLCGQYGADAVAAVMDRLLERTEALLRERLRALPDGRWRHVAYVEYRPHGGTTEAVYAVRLTMTKRGDDLELDFTGSDPQAPGTINAAYPALAGFAIGGVLIYLCGGLPWVPGGVWPVVRIRSREGTVVHARWPAGVAMSTAATCQAVRVSVNACLARMLEASRDLAHLVMASCQAAGGGGGTVHGERGDGTSYATMTLDEITGGGGATWSGDGADSSGYTTSPGASCANVEVNEAYLPLLYERRAELADTGGPGRHRGGVGTLHALTPHGDGASMTMMSFGQGLQHPLAAGVCGGEYGGQSVVAVVPDLAGLADEGERRLPMPSATVPIRTGELLVSVSQGGGGLGDPLDRDPAAVLDDVLDGLVSVRGALRDYGVVVTGDPRRPDGLRVDDPATSRCRDDRRHARIGRPPAPPAPSRQGRPLSAVLDLLPPAGDAPHREGVVACGRCGTVLCGAAGNVYEHLVVSDASPAERSPLGAVYEGADRFVLRRLYCPACAVQIDVQVCRTGDPVLAAIEVL